MVEEQVLTLEPLPQQIRSSGEPFLPPAALSPTATPHLDLVLETIRRWSLTTAPQGQGHPLVAGLASDREIARQVAPFGLLDGGLRPDGYALQVDPQGCIVVGADRRGLRYGLDTLCQLLCRETPTRATTVRDWPDMPVRGVFLTCRLGPTDPAVVADLIRRLARYRITHLCVELERGMRYESHPEVSAPWALDKEVFARFAALAAAEGIEFIPMLPTLNHVDYLLQAHPELAEGAERGHPDRYCPSNPLTWRLVTALLEEVIELFRPRLMHVGHDEVVSDYELTRRESVLRCPACRALSPSAWFAGHVTRVRDLLAGHDVRTVIWADMLLTPGQHLGHGASLGSHYGGPPDEIHRAVEAVPRDVVLCDWHYEVTGEYPSYDFLLDRGFTVLGSPWKAESIFTFAHRVHRKRQELAAAELPLSGSGDRFAPTTSRAPGLLCTNWCTLDASNAGHLAEQVRWAGEFSWTADRAAWLPPSLAGLLRVMEAPNPTREIPPGPFDVELGLGRLEGGLMWTAGSIAGQDGDGMVLKAHRTGFLQVRLTARQGCCFGHVRVALQGRPAGPVAVSVGTGASGAAWPVAAAAALDGRVIDLAPWTAAAGILEVRCDFRNDTDRPAQILSRIRVQGEVVPV